MRIARGEADVLTGRYIHASMHDLDDLLSKADEIVEKDLHAMRFTE